MATKDQVTLLKELFEAHLGPLKEDMKEVRQQLKEMESEAGRANKRIDGWENRAWGIATGTVTAGGGIGAVLAKLLPWGN